MFCAFLTLIRGCPIHNNRTDFKLGRCSSCINRIHPNKNQFTNFREKSVGVRRIPECHGLPNFWHLYYPRKRKSYGLKILYAYSKGRLEQTNKRPWKISGKVDMGVVIMQGDPKIFGALRGKLCDSIAILFREGVGGPSSPLGVCASESWSISNACKNLRGQHPLRAKL